METYNCHWCKKAFEPKFSNYKRTPRYCSPDCRYAYHNAQNRLKKMKFDIVDKLDWIKDQIRKGGELPYEAAEAIMLIDKNASIHKLNFKCRNCGQMRMNFPRIFDVCSFCGHKQWKVSIKED